MDYRAKLDIIFENVSRRNFLRTMGQAAGAAANAGKLGTLGKLASTAAGPSNLALTDELGRAYGMVKKFGIGWLTSHNPYATSDFVPQLVNKLREAGEFDEKMQIESVIKYYFSIGWLGLYDSDLSDHENMDSFEEMLSVKKSKAGDGLKSLAKLGLSKTSTPEDVRKAYTDCLSEISQILEHAGIDVPRSALSSLASVYFQKYLSAFKLVFNPATKLYENGVQKLRAAKQKSERLEDYDVPSDYQYGEPMHQPFESKLNKVLSLL